MTQFRLARQAARRNTQSLRGPSPIFGGSSSIRCEVVREDGFVLLGRSVLDLSETGLRVGFCDEAVQRGLVDALRIGEALWVSFRVDHIGMWFDFEAEVARVSAGRRPHDTGPSIGVRFVTRWDAGRSSAPALSRLLLKNGIAKLPKLVAPPALRGMRSARAPRIVDVDAAPNPRAVSAAILRESFQDAARDCGARAR